MTSLEKALRDFAQFAEDIGLLPPDLFTRLLDECRRGASSCLTFPARTARMQQAVAADVNQRILVPAQMATDVGGCGNVQCAG